MYPVHYGDTVDFAWVLPKRPRSPTIGVYCYQGGTYHYIAELSVARDLVGTTHGEIQIDNADSSAVPGTLDYSQPAYCSGVMWDEYANGQQPQAITNSVSFTVSP